MSDAQAGYQERIIASLSESQVKTILGNSDLARSLPSMNERRKLYREDREAELGMRLVVDSCFFKEASSW